MTASDDVLLSRWEYPLKDGNALRAYVHDILTYRYNWHVRTYEIDILLTGSMEFFRGGEKIRMGPGDMVIVNPGVGHASLALEPNTVAAVLQFPSSSFRDLMGPDTVADFHLSPCAGQDSWPYHLIRSYCATILQAIAAQDAYTHHVVPAAFELLRVSLFTKMEPELKSGRPPKGSGPDPAITQGILRYISDNYAQKLSLEELAGRFGFNRTYLSTFFKKNVGIGLYDYLTNVRFAQATWALLSTDDSLTKVALYNGFPDRKTFNRLFFDFFQMTPAEYRSGAPDHLRRKVAGQPYMYRSFRDVNEPEIRQALDRLVSGD